MLLRYSFQADAAADTIENAVEAALKDGWRTPDLYREGFRKADTEKMTEAVLQHIQ